MNRLEEIRNSCKCSISLEINPNRSCYQTVEAYLNEYAYNEAEISSKEFVEMVKRDTIFEITMYPDTPIGCYILFHYDLGLLLDKAINLLKEIKQKEENINAKGK